MKSNPDALDLKRIRRKLNRLINSAQQDLVAASDTQYGSVSEAQRHVGYAGGRRDALTDLQKYFRTELKRLREIDKQKAASSRRLAEARARKKRVIKRLEKRGQIYNEDDLDWMPS